MKWPALCSTASSLRGDELKGCHGYKKVSLSPELLGGGHGKVPVTMSCSSLNTHKVYRDVNTCIKDIYAQGFIQDPISVPDNKQQSYFVDTSKKKKRKKRWHTYNL